MSGEKEQMGESSRPEQRATTEPNPDRLAEQMGEAGQPEQVAAASQTLVDRLSIQMRDMLQDDDDYLGPPDDEFIDDMLTSMAALGEHISDLSRDHPLYMMWMKFRKSVRNYLTNIMYKPPPR